MKVLDQNQKMSIAYTIQGVRDYYLNIRDIITKSLDKIRKPQTTDSEALN